MKNSITQKSVMLLKKYSNKYSNFFKPNKKILTKDHYL